MTKILDTLSFALYPAVLVVGLASTIALLFGDVTLFVFLAPWATGAAIGWAIYFLRRELAHRRLDRIIEYLPCDATNLSNDPRGPQHIVITRNNGEQLMLLMPAGYDPAKDGGAALLEAACPDLPKDMKIHLAQAAHRLLEEEDSE